MSKPKYLWPVLFLTTALLAGCSSSDPSSSNGGNGDVPEEPSFSEHVQPIFNANCTASICHGGSAGGLTLTSGNSYDELVNVDSGNEPQWKRVLPDDAENSYLVMKLEGRQTVGARMPSGAAALPNDDIQTIRNWIDDGAEEN